MRVRGVLSLLLAAVLVAGCSSVAFWKDQFTLRPRAKASQDAQNGQSGQNGQDAQASRLPLGETFEDDIQLASILTERFWQQQFQASGEEYRPVQRFQAYRGNDGPACGGQPAVPDNAFYCPVGHFIAYDAAWLRTLYDELGDGAIYVIIPHEIGHAVQAQLTTDFRFNIERELQADCYAGGALKGMIDSQQLSAQEGDEQELLANLAAAGDPTDAFFAEDAHGTPEQRQQAFAKGYQRGAGAC
ncbi:hypothetical protein Sru01_05710 [Sphaerisporangium rufum]|uniref:Metalloprotease n=1 Tax=Sphaerisporangium rufum TaxID=1381558 RepID=A0A919QWW2_9ACTN|nr:neutral zinc metallopeptidase [Sphaerisporangium rufum]GII75589.1 hypothetical protein Sru01_05710 [Sphaerisporangium rufum]